MEGRSKVTRTLRTGSYGTGNGNLSGSLYGIVRLLNLAGGSHSENAQTAVNFKYTLKFLFYYQNTPQALVFLRKEKTTSARDLFPSSGLVH